ncbi:type II toxin-antitoxin system VapC family toxin [Flavobacterium wongokense]|uniref:type II toxin-antitoxin system VapC family toxin n=1 Tax=Flavobacterium wongokense TaxID=2910674 RepID=UPI001F274633|nr:PIN domain-containing protein [Flavobacterium sp. WG47]MCF6133443.1 PIN domain-containing protein [Flavobacterium sp. WG47]
MKRVCVDTNMLIWYIKRQCTEGQEDCLVKAEWLFNYFERKKIDVVIPSIVVAELLAHVEDEEEREGYFDFINDNFEVAQHDIRSARKYVKLMQQLIANNAGDYAKDKGVKKFQLTNDYNICSVALSSDCDAIFSHNLKDFEQFANHQIPIFTLDYVDVLKREEEAEDLASPKSKHNPDQVNIFDIFNDDDDEDDDEHKEVKIRP